MSIRSSVRNIMVTAGLASMVMVRFRLSVTTAQAGASTGTWRNGAVAGSRYGYGPRYGYAPRYYGGNRRGYNAGPAVAAGLVGGLAPRGRSPPGAARITEAVTTEAGWLSGLRCAGLLSAALLRRRLLLDEPACLRRLGLHDLQRVRVCN